MVQFKEIMKKSILTLFIVILLFFGRTGGLRVLAQSVSCSRTDITSFSYQNPQPANPGDTLALSLQTSANLFNQTLMIVVTNETTNTNVIGPASLPISSTGAASPAFTVTDRGNYRITISGTGGSICFDQTYGFSPVTSPSTPPTSAPPATTGGGTGIKCANNNSINTAIGCIPVNDTNALVGFLLKWGLGIGGGIAFLLILVGGFQIMTSRGDPNRLKAGQELMTSAIAGLLLLIFSLVILNIIGFDILQIGVFK